jgi:hypothetical protein
MSLNPLDLPVREGDLCKWESEAGLALDWWHHLWECLLFSQLVVSPLYLGYLCGSRGNLLLLSGTVTAIQVVGIAEAVHTLVLRSDPSHLFVVQGMARPNDLEQQFQVQVSSSRGWGRLVVCSWSVTIGGRVGCRTGRAWELPRPENVAFVVLGACDQEICDTMLEIPNG